MQTKETDTAALSRGKQRGEVGGGGWKITMSAGVIITPPGPSQSDPWKERPEVCVSGGQGWGGGLNSLFFKFPINNYFRF